MNDVHDTLDPQVRTTEIPDESGENHSYSTTLFGTTPALRLFPKVIKVIVEPLAHALGALPIGSDDGSFAPVDLQKLKSAGDVLAMFEDSEEDEATKEGEKAGRPAGGPKRIDGGALAGAFDAFAKALSKDHGIEFFKAMLYNTRRDDVLLRGQEFEKAFQGEMGELFHAVGWVVALNFGPVIRRPFVALGFSRAKTGS